MNSTHPSPSDGPVSAGPPLPAFPVRLFQVFVSPARLFDALRERPVWFMALLMGALTVAAGVALIPADVWTEMVRAQLLEAGQPVPPELSTTGNIYRIGGAIGGAVFWALTAFLFSGILTVVFAFVLGDRVSYPQLLAAYTHATFIAALGSLLITPLRVIQRDPQLTLSLGVFFPGLEGYAGAFLQGLDLFSLWGYFLVGLAVTRFDPRRTLGVAATITVGFFVALVAVFAIFQG